MSATVIDSLLVTLGLDKTSYDKGLQQADAERKKYTDNTLKSNKAVAESNRSVEQSLHSLKLELISAAAVFFGATGVKDWIANMVTGQAALGRFSKNLDISASRLDAWGQVAEEMGDKASDSLGALQNVAAGIAEATIKGHSALTDVARANGISLVDVNGKLLNSEGILLRFSERLSKLPRQQAMFIANQAGLGGISNELLLGPEELTKRLAAAQALSRATEESTKQAQELEKKWADLMRRFHGVQEEIFAKLEPTLERLFTRFNKWLDTIDFDKVISQIESFVKWVNKAVDAVGGWSTVLEVLGGLILLKVLSPLGSLVGFVARLATLGGATGTVSALGGAIQSLGLAVAGVNLAALGAIVGAAGLVYSPNTGGVNAKGQQVEDLTDPNAAGKRVGTSNADLWNKVLGKATAYQGTKSQAIDLLATRVNVDAQSDADLARTKALIWQGAIRPGAAGNAEPETALAGAGPVPGQGAGDMAGYLTGLEAQYGLPAGLLDRVWNKESGRSLGAITSPKGAKGPFQFTDATAQDFGLTGASVNDPHASAAAAAKYLSRLRSQFGGDLTMALAAYNWGPGNLAAKGLANAPAETQDYIHLADGLQLGPPQRYGSGLATPAGGGGDVTNETHVGQVVVNTQATDARGIVKDMRAELARQGLTYQANQGVE